MRFYLLANQFQKYYFYDFATGEDTFDFTETCLLPTKTMAEKYIENTLGEKYVIVDIEIDTYNKDDEEMSYTIGIVENWEDEEEEKVNEQKIEFKN